MSVSPISGYVLAGGRSSRMETDKSLLPLGGKPLIEHAVAKLRRVCDEVHILSANPALGDFAPLVPDLHPDCGPIGGIEAALAQSPHDWVLIIPVDVPFLPAELLQRWVEVITSADHSGCVAMLSVKGRTQPAVCLLHRSIAPSIAAAVALGEFKLLPVLEASAEVLALRLDQPVEQLLSILPIDFDPNVPGITPGDSASRALWFANLNTPEDFAQAEAHLDALDH